MSTQQITAAWVVSPKSTVDSIEVDPSGWEGVRAVYLFAPPKQWAPIEAWLRSGDRYVVLFSHSPSGITHPRLRQELLCEEGVHAAAAYTCLLPYRIVGASAQWEAVVRDARMTHDSIAAKMLDLNTHFYPHFYHNLRHLCGAYHGAHLYGRFTGVPAVICGAGPSLDRVMGQLNRVRNSALVLGCGSALTAMTRQGVEPHLGVAFSSSDEEAKRFQEADQWTFPIAYRLRLNRHAHAKITGPRLYTNGSSGLSVVRWVEEQLGIEGEELAEGPSVVHLATDLALKLGCNPIVYVGLDLAYTDGKGYASKVGAEDDGHRIEATDLHGHPIQTKAPWVTEAQLLGEAIAACPDTQFFNATSGGLGIPGVPIGDLPPGPYRPITRLLQEGLVPLAQVTEHSVIRVLTELSDSLERSIGYLKRLAYTDDVIAEVSLSMEVAYLEILEPMAQFQRHYLARIYDQFGGQAAHLRQRWQWLHQQAQDNLTLLTSCC